MTGLLLAATVLAPDLTRAQSPWKVTLTPLFDPLPIGYCGAIQIKLVDAAGVDAPRNPSGARVTMADFDIAVTAPDGKSVAAQRIDDYHWSACACQGAAVGTVGTVIATYPAARLDARARVPDVAFQMTAPFTVAAAKGDVNPPPCLTAAAARVLRGAGGIAAEGLGSAVPLPRGASIAPPIAVAPAPAPVPTGSAVAAGGASTGTALPETSAGRAPVYVPGPITVTLALNANGSWYGPSPVAVSLALSAEGSWYEPAPVTVTFDLSATGNWIAEKPSSTTRTLQPAPPGR
jgi:hypothetical protein